MEATNQAIPDSAEPYEVQDDAGNDFSCHQNYVPTKIKASTIVRYIFDYRTSELDFSMTNAIAKSLVVRPYQTSDISFGKSGVIRTRNTALAKIGQTVSKYDLPAFIAQLPTVDAATGRHKNDFAKIDATLKPVALFVLDNLELGAMLDIAITKRQCLYLQRYKHITDIGNIWNGLYPSRVTKINDLVTLNTNKKTEIKNAYTADSIPVVTRPLTKTSHFGEVVSINDQRPIGTRQKTDPITYSSTTQGNQTGGPTNLQGQTAKQGTRSEISVLVTPAYFDPTTNTWLPLELPTANAMVSVSSSKTDYGQAATKYWQIANVENEQYRAPLIELETETTRAEIALLEEAFLHKLQSVHVAEIPEMLKAELKQLDLEVAKLQAQLISTYILPLTSGTVTSILKDVGEYVSERDPVARIENSTSLLIVGTIESDRVVQPGLTANITTRAQFNTNMQFTLNGTIRSVFRNDANTKAWDVIIESINTAAPNSLPMNYQFNPDPAVTTVSIL